MPIVFREFAMVCSVTGTPSSATAPRNGWGSFPPKVAKSNRCPSTKTLLTMSPLPPAMP